MKTRIITGAADSGKSTLFLKLFNEENAGKGLFSHKLYENGEIIGYNLRFLPGEEEVTLARLRDASREQLSGLEYQGRFLFYKEAFLLGKEYILCAEREEPLWIDEVGGLELKGKGYDPLLQKLIRENRALTLVVRDSLLPEILSRYSLHNKVEVIHV